MYTHTPTDITTSNCWRQRPRPKQRYTSPIIALHDHDGDWIHTNKRAQPEPNNLRTSRQASKQTPTTMAPSSDPKSSSNEKSGAAETKPEQPQQKSTSSLEEDDEFEDFPVEGSFHRSSLTPAWCRSPSISTPHPFGCPFIHGISRGECGKTQERQIVANSEQTHNLQTGQQRRRRRRPPVPAAAARRSTCGRRAGMTTTRAMTSPRS